MIERQLEGFRLVGKRLETGDAELALGNDDGYRFSCSLVEPTVLRTIVTGPTLPPSRGRTVLTKAKAALPLYVEGSQATSPASKEASSESTSIEFSAGPSAPIIVKVSWFDAPVVEIHWRGAQDANKTALYPAFSDLPFRSYNATEHGISRYMMFDENCIHLGLGERAAPLDLTKRSFAMTGSDSASYDAYLSDPLYKHTPFLISVPRPSSPNDHESRPCVGVLSASESDAQWDVGRFIDEPWKMFKRYTQDWGGLDEYIIVDSDVQSVVRGFAHLVGSPQLVPRNWLGYLASGMGLGESDDPPAQKLLEGWPDTCRKHGIPCSAMHLSSGYTVDEQTGDRMVFTMNTKRYPDFAGMVTKFHDAGIAVAPNVKPYVLTTHPDFEHLRRSGALFRDAATGKPVITRIWASSIGVNANGSWIDMTSKAGRAWWRKGVASLVERGVDAIWNDNNEYSLHDDCFVCEADSSEDEDGNTKMRTHTSVSDRSIGLVGRMRNTQEMARCSADVLRKAQPQRRPLVLTRSANIHTMQHASSSWSGDNRTSWTSLRGSVAMVLNAQISLISSYGTDIGGFGGPQPSPELLLRWIQLGITHPRFCIHSYKPTADDPSARSTTTTPWMYPEAAAAIRQLILRRYELLPFWNDLQWRAHLYAEPCNTPLFWGDFKNDVNLYPASRRALQDGNLDGQGTSQHTESLDYWIGTGRLLFCGQYYENTRKRQVYLPRTSADDDAIYYDLHYPYHYHRAGSSVEVDTPPEHGATFAREGAIVPIGKPCVTSTVDVASSTGAALAQGKIFGTGTATPAKLARDGGIVELDDWRGVEIFPRPEASSEQMLYSAQWIEDDGESIHAPKAIIHVSFEVERKASAAPQTTPCDLSGRDGDDAYILADVSPKHDQSNEWIRMRAHYVEKTFAPLWGNTLHVFLPRGDTRTVRPAERTELDDGRVAWKIHVEDSRTI